MSNSNQNAPVNQHPWSDWRFSGEFAADAASFAVPFGLSVASVLRVRCPADLMRLDIKWIFELFATVVAAPQHSYMFDTVHSRNLRWWFTRAPADAVADRASKIATDHAGRPVRFVVVDANPRPPVEYNDEMLVEILWPPANLWPVLAVDHPRHIDEALVNYLSTHSPRRVLALRPLSCWAYNLERYFDCQHCKGRGKVGPEDAEGNLLVAYGAKCLHCDGGGRIGMRSIDWLLIGGNEVRPKCAVRVFDQIAHVGLPIYVEQLGEEWGRKRKKRHPQGEDISQWPPEVKRRDVPDDLRPVAASVPWLPPPPAQVPVESPMPEDVVAEAAPVARKRRRKPVAAANGGA